MSGSSVNATSFKAAVEGVFNTWIWDGSGKSSIKERPATGANYHVMQFKNGSSWEDLATRNQSDHHSKTQTALNRALADVIARIP